MYPYWLDPGPRLQEPLATASTGVSEDLLWSVTGAAGLDLLHAIAYASPVSATVSDTLGLLQVQLVQQWATWTPHALGDSATKGTRRVSRRD